MKTYAILTTPRTGSTLLCEYIANTGSLGMKDIDNASLFIGNGQGLKQSYPKRWQDQLAYQRTANGVAGLKFMFEYFNNQIRQHLDYTITHEMMNAFHYFVWLRREDILSQAISWHIALRSGVWHSKNRDKPPKNVTYDFDEIAWKVAFIEGMNARYVSWFKQHGIIPLEIWYRDVVTSPQAVLEMIASYLGVYEGPLSPRATLEKMSDPRKKEYAERYKRDRTERMALRAALHDGVAIDKPAG